MTPLLAQEDERGNRRNHIIYCLVNLGVHLRSTRQDNVCESTSGTGIIHYVPGLPEAGRVPSATQEHSVLILVEDEWV